MKTIIASGKRKTAVARANLSPGAGVVRVNSALLETIRPEFHQLKMREPLLIAKDVAKHVNIDVIVHGGGQNSQSEAVRLAIAKALSQFDKKLHKEFLSYDRQLLVADVRQKETHKPNCHGKARAKRQTSYR
ncbi:MAG TPA: 30S ribosomal protein S9 [Candidatus Binatia bacterium]|nr:30S ribosomal protein S9 [Candidatus Binatia bacterium]